MSGFDTTGTGKYDFDDSTESSAPEAVWEDR